MPNGANVDLKPTELTIYLPSNLFQRMDIGECAAIHDLALRADFEKASETKDYGYTVDVSWMIYYPLEYFPSTTF